MTWQSVGQHTFVPTDQAVQVGSFDLAAGQDTIWVRITQLNDPGNWPWSYGILSWRNANGTPLGSVKAYSNRLGEVFRLGNGLAPLDGVGSIWFEPRGFNLGWLKAGFPWELSFEAQAGATDLTSGYWNRDPSNGVITPKTSGDNLDMTPGWIKAKNLILTDGTGSSVEKEVPGYQQGLWVPSIGGTVSISPNFNFCRYIRVGNMVTVWLYLNAVNSGNTSTFPVYIDSLPYPVAINCAAGSALTYGCGSPANVVYASSDLDGLAIYEVTAGIWDYLRLSDINNAGNQGDIYLQATYQTGDTSWAPNTTKRSRGASPYDDPRI